jgi:predicted membrane-bound spermidine synthase
MYAWDLIGSLGGSLASSLILIPLFGIQETAWVVALFNLWAFAAVALMKQRN